MKSFIQKTIKPVLIIAGIFTASTILLFISPRTALEGLLKLEFLETYTILIQHWGMIVFLVGLFLIVSAFLPSWRFPIILFATVEKIFYVYLYIISSQYKYSEGFFTSALIDAIIVIYFVIYVFINYKEQYK